jgi:hypothetical protein
MEKFSAGWLRSKRGIVINEECAFLDEILKTPTLAMPATPNHSAFWQYAEEGT